MTTEVASSGHDCVALSHWERSPLPFLVASLPHPRPHEGGLAILRSFPFVSLEAFLLALNPTPSLSFPLPLLSVQLVPSCWTSLLTHWPVLAVNTSPHGYYSCIRVSPLGVEAQFLENTDQIVLVFVPFAWLPCLALHLTSHGRHSV